MTTSSRSADAIAVITEADRCVKCGLCLPHCPTYTLTRNEAESPRGRIALAEALARGALTLEPGLLAHLDHCLLCRACERACPSAVNFGQLMDHSRALTLDQQPGWLSVAAHLLSRHRWVRAGLGFGRLLPAAILPGGAALSQAARRLSSRRLAGQPLPPAQQQGPRVGLFLGCVSNAVQPAVAAAAQRLLEAAGATVIIPKDQTCCGALHGHLGDQAGSDQRSQRNRQAFDGLELEAIVSLASGCGIQLGEQSPALPVRHWDLSHYLLDSGLAARLRFAPLPASALVHTPCTLKNSPAAVNAVTRLLERIPQLTLSPLAAGSACCGAGGLHLITQQAQGAALRAPLIEAFQRQAPDLLITSNTGCALHLAAGLDDAGVIPLHPLEVLAQQLLPTTTDVSAPDPA